MEENRFQDLMRSLWKVMHIDLPKDAANEVYSITFGNQVEVHLLCTQAGQFDIISEAGVLHDKQSGSTILDLLALHQPPLTLNIDRNSGAVMVWARQEIDGTETDDVIELIDALVKTVQLAKQCINCGDARGLFNPAAKPDPMHATPKGNTTLAQLRRRN